jgi:hypothetical protein
MNSTFAPPANVDYGLKVLSRSDLASRAVIGRRGRGRLTERKVFIVENSLKSNARGPRQYTSFLDMVWATTTGNDLNCALHGKAAISPRQSKISTYKNVRVVSTSDNMAPSKRLPISYIHLNKNSTRRSVKTSEGTSGMSTRNVSSTVFPRPKSKI